MRVVVIGATGHVGTHLVPRLALAGHDAEDAAGTIWVHGPATDSPLTEDDPREPFGDDGTRKAGIARLLHAGTRTGGLPCTVLHPGHISGAGWPVTTPLGNLDPAVWRALDTGAELPVPGLGLETLRHVHADDVAQAFELALHRRSRAVGGASTSSPNGR
ncbi:NAD-dependent epimerase/dehydratase family protein [Kineococcus arenarius]|uniref:NAD-dependent epimerase/dehydratase family protein n=1 Tax=unclassified Kineococcus TaxID=2621656 RepID=UPI003D7CF19F